MTEYTSGVPLTKLFAVFCLATMLSCGNDPWHVCDAAVEFRLRSPDGRHDAILYGYGCGALAGDTTNISLFPSGTKNIDQSGNIFVAVEGRPAAPTNRDGVLDITLHWVSDNQLLITFPACAVVTHKVERFERYGISYLAVPCPQQQPASSVH